MKEIFMYLMNFFGKKKGVGGKGGNQESQFCKSFLFGQENDIFRYWFILMYCFEIIAIYVNI